MAIEVYSTSKPAVPRRAIILSLLLLIFTSILATDMSCRRAKEVYTKRIRPQQWDISFQPPRGFLQGEMISTEIGQAIPFQFQLQPDVKIELTIWRFSIIPTSNPAELSQSLMRWLHAQSTWSLLRLPKSGETPMKPRKWKLGNFVAYEIIDRRFSTVVRAGMFSNDRAYGVSMTIQGMPLDQVFYGLYEHTCRTIRLESD